MALIADFVGGRTPPDLYATYLGDLFQSWSDLLLSEVNPAGKCLDIACGTGIVSRALASSDGVESVEAIDVAPPMIAKAEASSSDVSNVRYQIASADELPFHDGTFDRAVCQQGLQFFPDKPKAVREANRVVKPGGTIGFAVWTAAADGCPAFAALETIVARDLGEGFVPFGPFALGDRDTLQAIANEAGVRTLSLEKHQLVSALPDPKSLVLFDLIFLGRPADDGSLQPLFDPTDGSKDGFIEAMIEEYSEAVSEFVQPDGTLLAPMSAHLLIAEAS